MYFLKFQVNIYKASLKLNNVSFKLTYLYYDNIWQCQSDFEHLSTHAWPCNWREICHWCCSTTCKVPVCHPYPLFLIPENFGKNMKQKILTVSIRKFDIKIIYFIYLLFFLVIHNNNDKKFHFTLNTSFDSKYQE